MKYYLDTEFNEFGGELISLALVREDGESLYLVYPEPKDGYGEWVKDNVVPIISDLPSHIDSLRLLGHVRSLSSSKVILILTSLRTGPMMCDTSVRLLSRDLARWLPSQLLHLMSCV
jgi:hypothetical protein